MHSPWTRALWTALLLLAACAKHVPSTPDVVHRATYAYQKINDGQYIVAAADGQALKKALAEIGCGKTFVCEIDKTDDLFDVEVHRK